MPHDRAGAALTAACSGGPLSQGHRSRPLWRLGLVLIAGVAAVAMLAPRAGELPAGLAALTGANPGWSLMAATFAVMPYPGSAAALQGAVPSRLPLGPLLRVQVAGAFATAIAPAGLANLALTARYLACTGVSGGQAAAAVLVVRTTTTVLHLAILAAFTPTLVDHLDVAAVWPRRTVTAIGIAAALVAAGALGTPIRQRTAKRLAAVSAALRPSVPTPTRFGLLTGGALAVTLTRAATMYACLRAMEVPVPLVATIGIFLAAEAAGAVAATPAGLGVLDGVLLTGLVTLGASAAPAIAAVLLFRLLTFWLPLIPGAVVFGRLHRTGAV
jgi:glycosyltransferase 2 family protein